MEAYRAVMQTSAIPKSPTSIPKADPGRPAPQLRVLDDVPRTLLFRRN